MGVVLGASGDGRWSCLNEAVWNPHSKSSVTPGHEQGARYDLCTAPLLTTTVLAWVLGVAQWPHVRQHATARLQATIKVQSVHLPMSITVLESGSMEFLFGLDMLRRYQCCIDLRQGVLRVGVSPPMELPFLAEHELPPSARLGAGAGAPEEGAQP